MEPDAILLRAENLRAGMQVCPLHRPGAGWRVLGADPRPLPDARVELMFGRVPDVTIEYASTIYVAIG
jgi:hypothetical protein